MHLQLRSAGLAAGLLALALAPPALAGPSVTIRVEGKAKTMVEEQRLATPDAPVPTSTGTCNGNTALGALHQAVAGDWSGNGTYGTEFVERIRDENYPLGATPDGWTFWVNNKEASSGPCDYTAQEGDQILYLVEPLRVRRLDVRESAGAAARAPSARRRRARPPPSEVTVVRYDTGGNAAPVEGRADHRPRRRRHHQRRRQGVRDVRARRGR